MCVCMCVHNRMAIGVSSTGAMAGPTTARSNSVLCSAGADVKQYVHRNKTAAGLLAVPGFEGVSKIACSFALGATTLQVRAQCVRVCVRVCVCEASVGVRVCMCAVCVRVCVLCGCVCMCVYVCVCAVCGCVGVCVCVGSVRVCSCACGQRACVLVSVCVCSCACGQRACAHLRVGSVRVCVCV
jgi:hypothetical protein